MLKAQAPPDCMATTVHPQKEEAGSGTDTLQEAHRHGHYYLLPGLGVMRRCSGLPGTEGVVRQGG